MKYNFFAFPVCSAYISGKWHRHLGLGSSDKSQKK